jgi:hypothetical protein
MFSLSMFGPFWCSVFPCSVPFEVRSFNIQSFDVRSHSTFSLSMSSPIRGSVFRCSVLFDVRSFEVRSFEVQSFKVRSFEVRSFEVRSLFLYFWQRIYENIYLVCHFEELSNKVKNGILTFKLDKFRIFVQYLYSEPAKHLGWRSSCKNVRIVFWVRTLQYIH